MNNPLSRLLNAEQAVAKALEEAKKPANTRADARYLELRQLPAVANYHDAKELKVSTKVSVSVNHETMPVVCTKTGITVEMVLPRIPGHVLEYLNPLSIYANVKGIISQGTDYMSKLDSQVLAGIWLTAYRHYDLIVETPNTRDSAIALNAMLRTAGKTILVDSLDLMLHINSSNAHKLPRFSLDYNAHREFASVGPALQEHNRAIRNVIYPSAESFYSKSKEAKELAEIEAAKYQDNSSYVVKTSKAKLSTAEKEYEERFILNRREAKQILARLTDSREIPAMFIAKLKPVFIGKNLVAMASTTRAAVVSKLNSYTKSADAKRLAVIVEEGHNPYDLFADIDDAFDEASVVVASNTPVAPKVRLSLAEILARKQAGLSLEAEPVAHTTATFVEAVVAEMQAEAVKLTYTEEDEIRHLEIEEAMEEGYIISDEDARWNNAYLRAKESQDYNVEDDVEDEENEDDPDF